MRSVRELIDLLNDGWYYKVSVEEARYLYKKNCITFRCYDMVCSANGVYPPY